MKFGVFDHVDRSSLTLADQFDRRLDYVAALDEAGFFCYHVAEHHATPLNMVPVPGVYLGAVANATRTIRLGPLCYLLPLYSVRRGKASSPCGCESRPASVAPAGSNRSG